MRFPVHYKSLMNSNKHPINTKWPYTNPLQISIKLPEHPGLELSLGRELKKLILICLYIFLKQMMDPLPLQEDFGKKISTRACLQVWKLKFWFGFEMRTRKFKCNDKNWPDQNPPWNWAKFHPFLNSQSQRILKTWWARRKMWMIVSPISPLLSKLFDMILFE